MPPRTKADTDVEQSDDDSTEDTTYVVLTDAFTFKVKGRRPGTFASQRARKGQFVKLDPAMNDIDRMIDYKAIAVNDGKPKRRTNAVALTQAQGGLDDPVRKASNLFDVTAEEVTGAAPVKGQNVPVPDDEDEPPLTETPRDDTDD
jgi:hypothetical protein